MYLLGFFFFRCRNDKILKVLLFFIIISWYEEGCGFRRGGVRREKGDRRVLIGIEELNFSFIFLVSSGRIGVIGS